MNWKSLGSWAWRGFSFFYGGAGYLVNVYETNKNIQISPYVSSETFKPGVSMLDKMAYHVTSPAMSIAEGICHCTGDSLESMGMFGVGALVTGVMCVTGGSGLAVQKIASPVWSKRRVLTGNHLNEVTDVRGREETLNQ